MLLREFLRRMCAAAAGGRCTTVARVRACAHARGRATAACAEARARAARAYLLRAQRQAGAAAVVAGQRLRQASDSSVGTFLWVAYGESAPKTPSPLEMLEKLVALVERLKEMEQMVTLGIRARELFDCISPWDTAFIITILMRPVAKFYKSVVPSAPETSCPFLGIRSLRFDEFPVEEGLAAVISLSASIGGVVLLCAGGLVLCLCRDMWLLVVGVDIMGEECYAVGRSCSGECTYYEDGSVEWGMF